jgi:hypothetical protein
MPGFDGTGPRGMGPMTGGGRGFCSPWGRGRIYSFGGGYGFGLRYGSGRGYRFGMDIPYTGAVPYGYPGVPMGAVPGAYPYAPQMTREQELDFLRSQAEAVRGQLEQIDARIKKLETE